VVQLVETKNVKAVKSAVRKTLTENGFLAIMAEVGSGKTVLFNHLCEFWSRRPDQFAVVEIKSFKLIGSRISIIMKLLIQSLDPEAHVPVTVEQRYTLLSQLLKNENITGRKVILIIDEAQDVSLQTLRDLKKIHEIDAVGSDHLFSIVLLGKTHYQWDRIATIPELGYRIRRVLLDKLTNEEIILFAEQRFGVKFHDGKTAVKFAGLIDHRTPLGVDNMANAVRWHRGMEKGERITITMQDLQSLPVISRAYRVKQAGVTQKQIEEAARQMHPGMRFNKQRISEFQNGKLDKDHPMHAALAEATERAISGNLGSVRLREAQ